MNNKEFIEQVATYVKKYAPQYGIKVYSPIIAQAIIESGWGHSRLATKYNNYFGLKCGSKWRGKSVNLRTKEEYTPGKLTSIRDNFRVYATMSLGIKGYFDFINTKRYKNLKGITDPLQYLITIQKDGYSTSVMYAYNLMKIIRQNNLTEYDPIKSNYNLKSTEEIAKEVINGLYGNGAERKTRLEKLGYNYKKIQAKVNQMLRKKK